VGPRECASPGTGCRVRFARRWWRAAQARCARHHDLAV